ncbi:antitoxin (DNA-binding transcriptional repressor) of toxin-antitoxin stability system [Paraburkholderia sp. GAS448]|jgi:antitoxin (DNA-binding transcriptional repressor) of toxin-antitoxin stability system|uniref:type II toxin-antitoxin system Phd/YefM family antitoxin n=1 Tax=Paraburkholderia sp. GAS448 TaxID=3035136 RepID=UPI003D21D405
MATVTATDLARRTNQVLDTLAHGESVTIKRNNTVLGTITPPQRPVTVREAFERMQKISREVGERFKADVRDMGFDDEVRDPWRQ